MKLSPSQQRVVDAIDRGKNVFMTGPGGSGKSALIRYLYERAQKTQQVRVQVCALTGCAAILLGCRAKTVHSFAGIGLGHGTIQQNLQKILKNPFLMRLWRETHFLIIDEVSMMSMKLFDMLDQIGRRVRRNPRPFGGIQLLFSGDFYQICPIRQDHDPDTGRFCFESAQWASTFDTIIPLETSFRQKDDVEYGDLLRRVRIGALTPDDIKTLEDRVSVAVHVPIEPTVLLPRRDQVQRLNLGKMSQLPEREYTYTLEYKFDVPISEQEKQSRQTFSHQAMEMELQTIRKNMVCEDTIRLKKGSQVMCIVNLEPQRLCNGSQGIVIDFHPEPPHYPKIRFLNGVEMVMSPHIWASETIPGIGISHIPLILAWALTIHKAQGATLDAIEVDAGSSIFEFGQTYVALSRVTSLQGLTLTSFDPDKILVNPLVHAFYASIGTPQYK